MKNYLPTLDGWRAIAIFIVIFAHGSDSIQNYFQSSAIFNAEYVKHLGKEGVNIFFGLSGFLITSRLLFEEREFGKISIRSFYIRRIFRILPAALTFVMVIGLLSLLGFINITLGRWLSTIFFLANYTPANSSWYLGHFWSLAVEEHFYFVWPFVFLILAKSNQRLVVAVASAFLIAIWRMIDFKFQITGAAAADFWSRTDIQVDNILWGVVAALAYADERFRKKIISLLSPSSTFIILLSIFIGITIIVNIEVDWKIKFSLLSLKAITVPLLLLWTVNNYKSIVGKTLESKPFQFIGKISYSLYLWQQLFLVWNTDRSPQLSMIQTLPINIVAALSCAILSYYLIEKPVIKIGHIIANKKKTQRNT